MDPYTVTMLVALEALKLVNTLIAATPPEILKERARQAWESEQFWRSRVERIAQHFKDLPNP